MDGRLVPARGVFALDTTSYLDALVQLGEEEARDLAVVEFVYAGPCLRAHGPLGIPLYRIPHTITSHAIRSVTTVATGKIFFQVPSGAAPQPNYTESIFPEGNLTQC